MYETLFWIYVVSTFTLVSARANYAKLTDEVKKDVRHKWEECCKANMCIDNSCFTVQWAASKWAAVRQRCQSQYPEWPYTVDIFRIQKESDLRTFWTMLQDRNFPKREIPKSVWTSGARCPKLSGTGIKLVTQWISTNEPFPTWLDEKLNSSYHSIDVHSNRCEFLVVSPAENVTDVKYDFQDQNARHATICEFSISDVAWTTTSVSTISSTIKEIASTATTKSEEQTSPVTKKVTSTQVTDVQTRSEIESAASSSSTVSAIPTEVPTIPTTTEKPRYCEAVNQSGIYWPKTKAGETVRRKCPSGMTGYAEWNCDAETAEFWPHRPQIEGCKHEWIEHIEDSILKRDDAVDISTRLSKETKHKNMSHGDIIALVNITANLFNLYIEQKSEEEFEVLQNEEMPVYYNFTKTMISSVSNILRVEIKDAWEGLNDTRQTKEASTILKLVTTMGSRLSCIKISSADKLQLTVSEENIDLQTFILNNTSENNEFVRFPQETEGVETNSFITLPANLKLQRWYSPCKNYKSAVGVVYKHVGDFLKAGQQESTTTKVATKVLSFSLSNSTDTISLSEGRVAIILQHLKTEGIRDQILENPRCVFWNFSKSTFGAWDETGCKTLYFNETHTVCECDHLTNFAVLMDVNNNAADDEILTWLTYICCGLSSVSLVLTLICFAVIRSLHGRRSIITGNLCFSLLVSNALIIFGLDKTENKIVCAIVAGVLHYWILSAFCWMLVEGYHLYRMVILVFQRGSNLPVKFYYLFAYGLPLAIVGVSAGLRYEGYGGSKYCWLSEDDRGLIWSFVGPTCAIILVNIVIFVLTLRSASSVKIKREQSTIRKIKSWIRGSISVMCLLGLTWCIGLFYIKKNLHFFSYIFTVLNGLQGVFIFLFHILLNDKVNSFFSCKENSKYGRKKFLNHTSSNQTNSKTSTRTSMNSLVGTSITKVSAIKNITSTSRGSLVLSNRIETVETGKSFRKNKVMHAVTSNGFKPQPTHYDTDVRIRSVSNCEAHRKLSQTSQKLNLTKF